MKIHGSWASALAATVVAACSPASQSTWRPVDGERLGKSLGLLTVRTVERADNPFLVVFATTDPDREAALDLGLAQVDRIIVIDRRSGAERTLSIDTPGPGVVWPEPWSPQAQVLALPGGNYGPLWLLPRKDIKRWLEGDDGARRTVEAPQTPDRQTVAQVHRFVAWQGPTVLDFEAACCGSRKHYRYNVATGELTSRPDP